MNRRGLVGLTALVVLAMVVPVSGCATEPISSSSGEISTQETWTEATHSNDANPDYDLVFPQDQVNLLEITIAPDDWEAMQVNAEELLGSSGTDARNAGPGAARPRPDEGRLPPGDMAQDGGDVPMGPGIPPGDTAQDGGDVPMGPGIPPDDTSQDGGDVSMAPGVPPDDSAQDGGDAPIAPGIPGWVDVTSENPTWVSATVECNGLTWNNVGIRYKGNSSLRSGWQSGSLKLPLKLDFDEFEDEYPEIEDQRFYGFKQLSLSNAFSDASYMRDALTSDILADAGLPVAETAFYEVIIDYGEGPVDLGLYVAIEVIDDTAIDRYFRDDSGNIYEGDGPGVSLAENTHDWISTSFQKENNEEEADWGDIENLYTVLHSEERLSDPDAWRDSLEATFNVDGFLEWLAIGSILEHWDSYGQMPHNFYVYDDPETGLLNWISWDHNEVLQGVSSDAASRGKGRTVSIDRSEVGTDWPLIRYLLDDPVYMDSYVGYLEKALVGSCEPENLEARCQEMAELIRPYVVEESDGSDFDKAVQQLIDRCYAQYDATFEFLAAMEGD